MFDNKVRLKGGLMSTQENALEFQTQQQEKTLSNENLVQNIKVLGEEKQSKRENMAKQLARKIEQIREHPIESIILFWNQAEAYFELKLADKILRNARRKLAFSKDGTEKVINMCKAYSEIINKTWRALAAFSQALYEITPEQWTRLNDPLFKKEILANRKNTIVFVPRSVEAAQIAIIIKTIGQLIINYRNSPESDAMQKLIHIKEIESNFLKELTELNQKLKAEIPS